MERASPWPLQGLLGNSWMVNWLIEQTISTRSLKLTSVKTCADISYDSSPVVPSGSSPSPLPSPVSSPSSAPSPGGQPLAAAVVQQIKYTFKMDYAQVWLDIHSMGSCVPVDRFNVNYFFVWNMLYMTMYVNCICSTCTFTHLLLPDFTS